MIVDSRCCVKLLCQADGEKAKRCTGECDTVHCRINWCLAPCACAKGCLLVFGKIIAPCDAAIGRWPWFSQLHLLSKSKISRWDMQVNVQAVIRAQVNI